MCHLACSASDFPHPSRSSSLLLAEVRKGLDRLAALELCALHSERLFFYV